MEDLIDFKIDLTTIKKSLMSYQVYKVEKKRLWQLIRKKKNILKKEKKSCYASIFGKL